MGHDPAIFRDRFWFSLILAVPILLTNPELTSVFGFRLDWPGVGWVAPLLATVTYLYGGWPFLKGSLVELGARRPGMMLLIALAITAAMIASWLGWFALFATQLWWEVSLLIVIMLLGHWLEMRAVVNANSALSALSRLLPDLARRINETGETESVSLHAVHVGDIIVVRPGDKVPVDGSVTSGRVEIDESALTGESTPVVRGPGTQLTAGSITLDGSAHVRVDAVGDATKLAGIQALVAEAEASNSHAQALADRAAAALFYIAVATALVTAVVWLIIGTSSVALNRSLTVLVIACPHAMGLAIPLVIAIASSKSARNGILVKSRLALERMRTVDTVLFDKTGTLTTGEQSVHDIVTIDLVEDELLGLAAAVEAGSEHPLARAIGTAAKARNLPVRDVTDFSAHIGRGVEARVGNSHVAVGGPNLLRLWETPIPDTLTTATVEWSDRGATILYVLIDGRVRGALSLADRVRPESREAIRALRAAGISVAMITGDSRAVADTIATELGMTQIFAEVLPADKDSAVTQLQGSGKVVAMVGDGVNDAPALARADVGIAVGAGTDVAIQSADIVLASNDPRSVLAVVQLSTASYRKMVQNLWWAAGYNIFAIPLAAGVFAWAGIVLPIAVGAALMSTSTMIVAINAQLLRRLDLRPQPDQRRGGAKVR